MENTQNHDGRDLELSPQSLENRVTQEELGHRICQWPLGDPQKGDFGFCELRTREHSWFCTKHTLEAYQLDSGQGFRKIPGLRAQRELRTRLGASIRETRLELDIPTESLCRQAGISQATLMLVETGSTECWIVHCLELAEILQIDPGI